MTWHEDLKRIADALERAYPEDDGSEYTKWGQRSDMKRGDWLEAIDRGFESVTPDDDDDEVAALIAKEAQVEVTEPECTHSRQNLRSNGDVGCADCPVVIIPKTGVKP